MTDLTGKKALVTGASRGIGQAIALALGARGAQVYGTATSDKGAASIDSALAQEKITGAGLVLDFAAPESLKALAATLKERDAMPDILVNNAGIIRDGLVLRMSEEDWDAVIAVNLKSVYQLSKLCARTMSKARWGRIINITSVSALIGNAGQSNYAAAKAGVIGFTRSLAREVASRGVTVNCIAPGFIDVGMTEGMSDEQREAVTAGIPVGRFGTPAEVAHAVVLLADPGGSYITGETVCVSGGLYMT